MRPRLTALTLLILVWSAEYLGYQLATIPRDWMPPPPPAPRYYQNLVAAMPLEAS